MKVKVSLGGSSHGGADNIQITADATVTVGDVAASLAHSDRRQGQWPTDRALTLRVVGEGPQTSALPPDRTLVESGIRSGSTLQIAYAEEAEAYRDQAAAAAVLRVVAGPDAGREFMLPLGSSTLGRAADANIQLSDPMISKQHCRVVVGARVEIIDAGSSNGVVVGGVRVPRTALASGEVAQIGDSVVSISLLRGVTAQATTTDVGFIRSPRVIARPSRREIELPDAPKAPQPNKFPWLALVAPLLMGGVLLVTRLTSAGGGLGKAWTALIFVAISPLLMLGNYFDQRGQRKRQHREEIATFDAVLENRQAELAAAHDSDRQQLLVMYPSVAECVDAVQRQGGPLWSRRPEHPEFLRLRLGLGDIEPLTTAGEPRADGILEYYQRATAVASAYATLSRAPVVTDLRSVGGVGVCGDEAVLEGVARSLVVQVAALHSPAEVVLVCLTNSEAKGRWEWLEWLPHTASPHSPLPGNHLAADPGNGKLILNQLEELISVRASGPAAHRGPLGRDDGADEPTVPSVVVVIDESSVDLARLTRVAETGPDVGVYVLWVSSDAANLPAACRTFIDVSGGTASVGLVRRGRTISGVGCELVDRPAALAFARRMAPMFDAGTPVDDQSDLPRSVSVVSLFGHDASDDANVVLNRWRENQSLVDRTGPAVPREREGGLVAVVGHAGTEQFTLDLRSQGPHALVGGTTGAGKSEFLQAWVLGLAHAYSPDRLTFLFVDYKGGAAFARCLDLPHTVGLVTDLSPYLVRRALRSLRAELHHRERLLNAKGKKDLIELEKTGDPECPPSLIIVVDEFAALVGEVPEFVDGVVDVAQRGRSLGLHLVLATQRPAGVIKDNLRANTNLRIALRMADESDSQDVLGDQMAAHFPASIPGRGAAKTGPGRITQFQSAFPGARTAVEPEVPVIEVVDLDFGPSRPWKMPERPQRAATVEKDIDRVVGSIASAAMLGKVPTPRKPWLEPLASTYNLARGPLRPRRDTRIPLGVIDDPDMQAQVVEYYEPDAEGNLVYFGAGGSGKTTALRTLAVASAITPGGGIAHVYGIDFSGGALTSIEGLPNVGSVISGEDEERVQRLIMMLGGIAEERALRYREAQADTLAEYRVKSGNADEPRILLLLDGFTPFRAAFESSIAHQKLYAQFQKLLDSRSVGIHVAMTADRPTAVPNSILSAFQRRIVLRQSDEDAYVALSVPRDVLGPGSPAGRAIQADRPMELQLAVFLSDQDAGVNNSSSAAQIAAMDQLAVEIEQHHTRPAPILSLPTLISSTEMPVEVGGKPVLGVTDETLGPIGFDSAGVLMVAGPAQSGRTNAVHWLATAVRRRHPDVPLVHLSARRTPLSALDLWTMTADNESAVAGLLSDLDQVVSQPAPDSMPLVAVFVEYLPEFLQTSVESSLLGILQKCRRNGHLVVAEGESPSWGAPWPLLMEIRNARTGLLLQPDQADGENLLRTPLPRVKRADLPPGRGYWVKAGGSQKVQIPLVDEWGQRPIDSTPESRQDLLTEQANVEA